MKNIIFVILGVLIASGILFAALPSGATTVIQPTIPNVPIVITIPSDPSPINITVTPSAPDTNDIVNITVRYLFESRYRHIEIFVNDGKVATCESNICSWKGGPFDYLSYFVAYKNQSDATITTSTKTLIQYSGPGLIGIAAPSDKDNDTVWDINDNCIEVVNKNQTDSDGDEIGDACDNCMKKANVNQTDSDLELSCNQDASDPLSDAVTICQTLQDGFGDACDNCPEKYNPDQNDTDKDGIGDTCDNCVKKNNTDQEDLDDDGVGEVCDNCEWWENPDQNDSDYRNVCPGSDKYGNPGVQACYKEYDGIGDECDNCPENYNPSQSDSDSDGAGDMCDNCPDNKNFNQRDTDNDGIGDGCDCDDKVKGENEVGADCGGICGNTCPACIPLLVNGNPAGKIDIVFVPDKDYHGDTKKFLSDIDNLIQYGYFGSNTFNKSRCKFNFYYYPKAGDYREVCAAWDLPAGFDQDCAFADSAAIIFTGPDRACASGTFSAPSKGYKTVVHETGHSIFGMADEYCCDGGYWQPNQPYPNIFGSKTNCTSLSPNPSKCQNYCPEEKCWPGTASAITTCKNYYTSQGWPTEECDCTTYAKNHGLSQSLCTATTSSSCPGIFTNWWTSIGISQSQLTVKSPNWCNWRGGGVTKCCGNNGNGWWKSDQDNCTMLSGTQFEPSCVGRISEKMDSLTMCNIIPGSIKLNFSKRVIIGLQFNIKGETVVNHGKFVDLSQPPDHFEQQGEFRVRVNHSKGTYEFYVPDPRMYRLDNVSNFEQGVVIGNESNFTIILPYLEGMDIVEFLNDSSGEVLGTVGIKEDVEEFCIGKNEQGCSGYQDTGLETQNQTSNQTGNQTETSGGKEGEPIDTNLIIAGAAIVILGAGIYWWLAMRGK